MSELISLFVFRPIQRCHVLDKRIQFKLKTPPQRIFSAKDRFDFIFSCATWFHESYLKVETLL